MSPRAAHNKALEPIVHPNLTVISGQGGQSRASVANPFYMSQSYNISACDPPDQYVQLPYPNDGNCGWEVIAQSGDLDCVHVWQWNPGEGAPIARAVLTWKHQGQMMITYASCGNGNTPAGGDVLHFTINAC